MPFVSAEIVIKEGNLGQGVNPALLSTHIDKAELELRQVVSSAEYDRVLALADSDIAKKAFVIAEANLCLAYAVHALNIETNGNGIVRNQGWDSNRNELLSRTEVKDLSEYFRDTAMRVVSPYIPATDSTRGFNLLAI